MATKEDILEQLVEEFLIHKGYFVRHNVKFLPKKDHPEFISNQDSNHSDIDVVGYNPKLSGADRVWVVSCKSWQGGFSPERELQNILQNRVVRGREAWKSFRELVMPKWTEAFVSAVEAATGQDEFTYVLAVTKVIGEKSIWESNLEFKRALNGNPIRVIELKEMLNTIYPALGTTLAGTEVGRMLQLFKATGIKID
ncbi:MAG: hypothetical protein ACOH1I_06125 [Gallionellaceae bacterium]|jgi:hypothetical protein